MEKTNPPLCENRQECPLHYLCKEAFKQSRCGMELGCINYKPKEKK